MRADRDHNEGFGRVRLVTEQIVELRRQAWGRIVEHLAGERCGREVALAETVHRVCVLASSSRGGTSVTAEMLQWQGADCDEADGRLLTLPGEEKPHLILSGLAFPTRPERFDDLDAEDARISSVDNLLRELSSEIGFPISRCNDLRLYSLQLYRRLLLQWPMAMVELCQESAIQLITDALRCAFPKGYYDTPASRRLALACCVRCFPFIRSSFYDRSPLRDVRDVYLLDRGAWSFEEPPFVFPPPWHNATEAELERGTLLLRDPSNAWRLPFWKSVFSAQDIRILHLVRDVAESLQGLCDGWNYRYGFQTIPSDEPLRVPGYTDHCKGSDVTWKQHRLNFSIDRQLSDRLLADGMPLSLVEVCGHQWRGAHERILRDSEELCLPRVQVGFSDLREEPLEKFEEVCTALNLEVSRSGAVYAGSFSTRWVMTTVGAYEASHERWRQSQYTTEISRVAESHELADLVRRLGMYRRPASAAAIAARVAVIDRRLRAGVGRQTATPSRSAIPIVCESV